MRKHNRSAPRWDRLLGGLAVSGLILIGSPVCAEDTSAKRRETFQVFQEAEEMVTAAARHAQSPSEAPANSTVITAADIQAYGYRTLGEALQSVPGFYLTDDRNYSSLWVRGFGRPGDYNNRILLLLNGHRLNENVYGGAYVDDTFPVPIQSVQQIEVIKGPGSALYGNNAFFAVVNVVTKTPVQADTLQVNGEGGSYGTSLVSAGLSRKTEESDGLYASASYRHMHGQDLLYPEFRSINNGVAANADGEENYDLFTSWAGKGLSLQGAYGSRTKHIPTASFDTRFNDPNEQTTDNRGFVEMKTEQDPSSGIHYTGRLYVDQYDYHGYYPSDNAAPPPAVTTNRDYGRAFWYGEETTVRLTHPSGRQALLLGQDYEQTHDMHMLNFNDDPYALFTDTRRQLDRYAFFAQEEWSPWTALELNAGARYDHDQTFKDSLNPRLSAVVHVRETSVLKLLYGTAFRAPNSYELFFQDGTTIDSNENLKPEKIATYEADWIEQLGQKTSLSIGAFWNEIRDLINQVINPTDGKLQFQNIQNVRSRGLETNLKWEQGPYSGHAGYVYQETYVVGGTLLSNSPRHTATAGLSRRWAEVISVSTDAQLVGSRRTFQNTTLPLTMTQNIHLSLTPWRNGLRLYAGIFNLWDTDYRVSGAAEHVQDAIPQNGRNFYGGVEYRFQ